MERYFRVDENTQLSKDYFAWKENSRRVNEHVKDFFNLHEIEAEQYHAANDALYIVPSESDAERFSNVLLLDEGNGLRRFKKTSKLSKAWVEYLKIRDIQILRKPQLLFYLPTSGLSGGRFRSRLFDYKDVLYCSRDPFGDKVPQGFTEMKASEFFKVIEEAIEENETEGESSD